MGRRDASFCLLGFLPSLFLLGIAFAGPPSDPTEDSSPIFAFDSIQDIVQAISAAKSWNPDQVHISNIDFENAKFTKTMVYELDLQVGDRVFPAKFTDEIAAWQRLGDLDAGPVHPDQQGKAAKDLWNSFVFGSVLEPFQLAGPVDLSFEDAETSRISLQDENDTKDFEKVMLADRTLVTVEGAREVSLTHPVELPLPLNRSSLVGSLAASFLSLAAGMRHASEEEEAPILSLRVVGPRSLVASVAGVDLTSGKIQMEQVDAGVVKLLYKVVGEHEEQSKPMDFSRSFDKAWIWPFPSVNSSDSKLLILEAVLKLYLGSKAYREGPFTILHAKVAASTFVLFEIELERKLTNENFDLELWPEWKTRPTIERRRFQVLAKVEDRSLVPIVIRRLKPYRNVETYTWRDFTSNMSYTSFPSFLVPSSPMTLDVN